MSPISLQELFSSGKQDYEATVQGWVRSVRKSKHFSFVVVNDGSTMKDLQVVADLELPNYEAVSSMITGTSVAITGKVVMGQGRNPMLEMQAKKIEVIGAVDESYPIQKKATSLEFLREKAHLRFRTR